MKISKGTKLPTPRKLDNTLLKPPAPKSSRQAISAPKPKE